MAASPVCRRHERVEKCDGAARRTELALDELLSASARSRSRSCGSVEAAADEGFELFGVLDDDGGIGGRERGDDVAEVPGVGAERDGGAVGGRLDHVLAAAVAEAAADEGDVRGAPPGAELADGVDEQDARQRASSRS